MGWELGARNLMGALRSASEEALGAAAIVMITYARSTSLSKTAWAYFAAVAEPQGEQRPLMAPAEWGDHHAPAVQRPGPGSSAA